MKPTKLIVILASISAVLILIGLCLPWMFGEPTGKVNQTTTQTADGRTLIEVGIVLEKISGWEVMFTGLTPACIVSTFGPKSTLLLALVPLAGILMTVLVILPWRKRKITKADGFVLLGMGVLLVLGLNTGKPICPAVITDKWTYVNGPGTLGNFMEVFALLLLVVTALIILFKKFPKPGSELPPVPVEYRMCLKCMTSVDKRESVCPNCGNRMG